MLHLSEASIRSAPHVSLTHGLIEQEVDHLVIDQHLVTDEKTCC